MVGRNGLLTGFWARSRWWWVLAGWALFVGGFCALIAVRALLLRRGMRVADQVWTSLAWAVAGLALVLVAVGTASQMCKVFGRIGSALAVAAVLVLVQGMAGYCLAMRLAVAVHLWCGGPL